MTDLRPLGPDDRAAVADLLARAADYVLLETGQPPGDATLEDFFSDAPPGIDPATSLRLGAAAPDGRLAGIAELAFGWPAPHDAYIGLLLLDPAARGQGLGRTMVAALRQAAIARGATQMRAAVLDSNPRGLAFWQREGFTTETVIEGVARGQRTHRMHRLLRPLA